MKLALVAVGVIVLGGLLAMLISPRTQFVMGGALVNAGFRLQDSLHAYDFNDEHLSPAAVWNEFKSQNDLASSVRHAFPRSTEHPVMALLVCMDARIDTSELAGDTRRYYYVVRTAGSVFEEPEQEMLELAVANGVKVLVLTRHSDCAAEKAAADAETSARFPQLTAAVKRRDDRVEEFLRRPLIAEKIAKGELLVKQVFIDTGDDHIEEQPLTH
jgi:carbonic anhydrase